MFFHPATLGHLPTSPTWSLVHHNTSHQYISHTHTTLPHWVTFFSFLFPLQAGSRPMFTYSELKVCCCRSRYWSVVHKCLLFGRYCIHPPHITLPRENPLNSVIVPTPLVHPQPGNITLAFLNKQLGNSSQPAPPTPPTSRPLLTPWQWR